jgi:hypothetical protein
MSVQAFLSQLFPNEGLRTYMTRELLAPSRKIYVLCGSGSNGKTTFMEFAKKVSDCHIISMEDNDVPWKDMLAMEEKPVYLHVNHVDEIRSLSADMWDRLRIVPMTSRFVERSRVDESAHRYLADSNIHTKLDQLAEEFLEKSNVTFSVTFNGVRPSSS